MFPTKTDITGLFILCCPKVLPLVDQQIKKNCFFLDLSKSVTHTFLKKQVVLKLQPASSQSSSNQLCIEMVGKFDSGSLKVNLSRSTLLPFFA